LPIVPTRRNWTCHWQNKNWRDDINAEGLPITAAGSNLFREKGVRPGDRIYIVSILDGQLLLGGRMTVADILTRADAVVRLESDDLYEDAKWWSIGNDEGGTPLDLHRALSPELTKKLFFVAPSGPPKRLQFVSATELDGQTTRGLRRLTDESAELLERIIALPTRRPRGGNARVITRHDLEAGV
jgi:hypothetical protein